MFAYSYPTAKELHKESIKELVGCKVLLLDPKGYRVVKDADEGFLETVHRFGVPYVASKLLEKNTAKGFPGAVIPDYGVLDGNHIILIQDKKLLCIGDAVELGGVYYDNTQFLHKNVPTKQVTNSPSNDYSYHYGSYLYMKNIGTLTFKEPYCFWSNSMKRWAYNSTKNMVYEGRYTNVYVNRVGMYEFATKPNLDGQLDVTEECHALARTMRKKVWEFITDAKKMAEREHTIAPLNFEEIIEYIEQIRAGGLVLSAINILLDNKKRLDIDGLYTIISTIESTGRKGAMIDYMFSIVDDLDGML